ncbi:USP6 N-terminal-like protein [Neolamprologus brichardi]|uniref:USP6 N-terminal-like protein n=1 Tax=Neolamprologus brichardi TaxID=32507 RepID=UPI0003EC59A5|nr:USP6 N-terminal-like protein [Neolamprologus brichardi]
MKKDIDTLIAEERAEIISKYDKGRQEGVSIDPWEDADYSIYKITDRFGFLHEEELPTPSVLEEKQKQQELERVEKWLKMVKKWDKYKSSEKVDSHPSTFRHQHLSPYTTYSLLTNFFPSLLGFFIPGFPKLHRFQAHHELILSKMLPKLKKHLDKEQMTTGIYTTKWFLQCFIERTPFTLTLRLWDIYILEGEKMLSAMAYTILKLHKSEYEAVPCRALSLDTAAAAVATRHTMEAEEEIMDLPDLPPPPFIFPNQSDQMPLGGCSPHLGARTGPGIQQCSHSPRSASPLVNQIKLSPKLYPKPPTSLDIMQKKPLPSKPSPNRAFTDPSSSPRLPPKPTKFPVSLYVPASAGDRRPSNTSQYDNLSEVDEDDRSVERVLSSTPEEIPSLHNNPSYNREYDPAVYPLPPPPVYMHHSASPPSLCALPSLPQEPEYAGEGSWVEDPIFAPPPPSFADRLSPLQCTTASCSDPHKAMSPGYSKPFSRGPRDHSAFPAPLLYTGSPPAHLRSSGQSEVGVPLVQSSPDFCRVPQSGHQLPKSVTF